MKTKSNSVRLWAGISCFLLILAACGGGGDTAVAPDRADKGVFTGFFGDYDWDLYNGGQGPGEGGGSGVGGGADGDGGVGVGGALGQFRGALVKAFFPDGSLLGEALTDNSTGMVTIKPGKDYNGSLLIEIHGQAGANYFDEGKDEYVSFGPGQVLHSIIPHIRRNIGITPFSEAGYQLAVSCQNGQGPAAVCGASLGLSNGTLPSYGAATAANEHVATVLNQQLPFALQVDDVTRIPVIVGDTTGSGAADTNERGRYGLANIAFSKQAAMYNTTNEAPTLLATQQLAKDLLDGKLDGKSNGASSAAASQRTYDPHSFTSELTAALAQQTRRYGTSNALNALPLISAFGNVRYDGYYFDARVGVSGDAETVAVATETASTSRAPGDITEYVTPAGDQAAFMVYGNMGNGGLIIKTDSANSTQQILALGDNVSGELGVGNTGEVERPAALSLPGILTHAAGGFGHLIARFSDGSVYTVGDNSEGQLGVGMDGAALPSSLAPQQVPLPAGALSVAAANATSFALLEGGDVYSWGSGWGFGTLGDGAANGLRVSPAPVNSTNGALNNVVQLSARDNDAIALKEDNSVWTWGSFSQNFSGSAPLGVQAGNAVATRVNGLPAAQIRKILTEQGLFIAVVGDGPEAGAVYTWGIHFDITAQNFLYDLQPTRVLNLPPVRDVMPGGFNGYGQRPFDRLTAMAVDYSGRYWKIRGRVAERYDPLDPTAQRRPRTQAPREDCASCHTVRANTDPVLPTTGTVCALPAFKLDSSGAPVLVNSASDCASCHNGNQLSSGRVLAPLTCAKPALPAPGPLTMSDPLTEQCAIPTNHPVSVDSLGNSCASCHNSVVTAALSCSPDNGIIAPPSQTRVTFGSATDDAGQITGGLQSGGFTDDTTPSFTGTLSAALLPGTERVQIRANGAEIGNASVSGTSWTFTPQPLAEGSYSFTGRVVNSGGASGQTSEPFQLTISTSSITSTANIDVLFDNVQGDSNIDNGGASNDSQLQVIGTISVPLPARHVVRIERQGPDGMRAFDVGTTGATQFSVVDPNAMQANDRYVYTARVASETGALGAVSAQYEVTFDNVPPAPARLIEVFADYPASSLPINGSISPNGGTNDNTPELRAVIDNPSPGDGIEFFEFDTLLSNGPVAVNGQGFAAHTHNTNFDILSGNASSTATFFLLYNVRSVDAAGNRSAASAQHRVNFGYFQCETLRQLNGDHQRGQTCTNCHTNSNERRLHVPQSGTYWCSRGTSDLAPLPR